MEVRFLQQFAESLLSHDVPDRHVDVGSPVRPVQFDLFLRDLRAERRDVPVVELVLDESSDEAGLADRAVSDEADLRLHVLEAGQRGRVRHAAPKRSRYYGGGDRVYIWRAAWMEGGEFAG